MNAAANTLKVLAERKMPETLFTTLAHQMPGVTVFSVLRSLVLNISAEKIKQQNQFFGIHEQQEIILKEHPW